MAHKRSACLAEPERPLIICEHCKPLRLPQVVLEGNLINLDVTAPGATLALGLMYLKTNDAAVARSFAIPDTHFALDYVKPEAILLRVLARGLVMWDEVAATREWVQAQLPDILKARLRSPDNPQGSSRVSPAWCGRSDQA